MSVTERLMAAGQWNITLNRDTPKAILDLLDHYGHVYIFDTTIHTPLADVDMIANSRWGGIVRIHSPTPREVGGVNMIAHLGDEDGNGPIMEVLLSSAAQPFWTYVGNILSSTYWGQGGFPPAVQAGTAYGSGAQTATLSFQYVTPRQAIDSMCAVFNKEYRVRKDCKLDADDVGGGSLFKSTPTAIAMRRNSGRDPNIEGLPVTRLDVAADSEEYITRILAAGTGQTAPSVGVSGAATPYKDLFGNLIQRTKSVSYPLVPPGASLTQLATNLVTAGQVLRQQVALNTDLFSIDRVVTVGDYIYVYDVEGNLTDPNNPASGVRYRGSIVYPIKLRVLATTWPVEQSMGVWYRSVNGVWTDITRFVLFEHPGVSFEVGAIRRPSLRRDQWDRLHS